MRDAITELLAAIGRWAGSAPLRVEELHSTAWHSATFSGARHRLTIYVEALNHDLRIEACELRMPNHLVADVDVDIDSVSMGLFIIKLNILTVEKG